ncbi:hypothetical protein ACS0TY_012686 [Phlomoides rotata]
MDLPLLKRKFTWHKDNGECCSRIDRFLLSSSWCNRWPNAKQFGLKRKLRWKVWGLCLERNIEDVERGDKVVEGNNGTNFSKEIEEAEQKLEKLDENAESVG